MVDNLNNEPIISVVMPVKNGEQTIGEAIDSILSQTFVHFELIIINDKSEDRTSEILTKYSLKDARIRVFDGAGTGISDALNQGLDHARGRLYARMDADDISTPQRLELQYKKFADEPDLVLLGSDYIKFDVSNKEIARIQVATSDAKLREALLVMPTFAHPSVMVSTTALRKIGGYRKQFDGAEDHDMYLRISQLGSISSVPEILLKYRIHAGQVTQVQSQKGTTASIAAIFCRNCVVAGEPDPANADMQCSDMAMFLLMDLSRRIMDLSKKEFKLYFRVVECLRGNAKFSRRVIFLIWCDLLRFLLRGRLIKVIKFAKYAKSTAKLSLWKNRLGILKK